MLPSTAKIISVCKRNYDIPNYAEDWDTIDALKLYVSFYTGIESCYVDKVEVKPFLRDAVLDFLQSPETQDKELFIRRIYDCLDSDYDEMHAYVSAFKRVRVRDKNKQFVNGFNEYNINKVDLINGNL